MSPIDPSRTVRWAQAIVNGMDAVSETFLHSMATIGTEQKTKQDIEAKDARRLGVFLKATSRAATGVKWSLVAVTVTAILAMVGVLTVRRVSAPVQTFHQRPALAQQGAPAIPAVIRLKCAKGAYRDLPEIQASACGKPTTTAQGEVQ